MIGIPWQGSQGTNRSENAIVKEERIGETRSESSDGKPPTVESIDDEEDLYKECGPVFEE